MRTVDYKPGDVIGFAGHHWRSAVINILTGGIPFWSLSHVGIISHGPNGELLLYESTEYQGIPDAITGKKIRGVQAHRLSDVVDNYGGKIWLYPLTVPLTEEQQYHLANSLIPLIGTPYDDDDVWRSGGYLFALLESMFHEQDLHKFFCSELVAYELSNCKVFPTENSARWSPRWLMKTLLRNNIVQKPTRLK